MTRRSTAAAALAASALAVTIFSTPAHAAPVDDTGSACFEPASVGAGARSVDGSHGRDTRPVTREQQRAIDRRMDAILSRSPKQALAGDIDIPVYVHVMRAADGTGNATKTQIQQQIAVLNATYGGD